MPTVGTHHMITIPVGTDIRDRAEQAAVLQEIEDAIQHPIARQTNGSGSAYETDVPFKSYFDGMMLMFVPTVLNTGACTININSLGAKKICDANGTVVTELWYLRPHKIYKLLYDATLDGGAGAFKAMPQIGGDRQATYTIAASNSIHPAASGALWICDGVADEVQINDAISSAIASGGGTICLLEGTYNIADDIVINAGTDIVLQGLGGATKLNYTQSIGAGLTGYCIRMTGGTSRSAVRDLLISHNVDNSTALLDIAISIDGGSSNVVERVRISETLGVWTKAVSTMATGSRVRQCIVAGNVGLSLYGNDSWIDDNYVAARDVGIYAEASGFEIAGNRIDISGTNSGARAGIDIDAGIRGQISRNRIVITGSNASGTLTDYGILLAGGGTTGQIGISNNGIAFDGAVAIHTRIGIRTTGDGATISANIVEENGANAGGTSSDLVVVDNSTDVACSGNTFMVGAITVGCDRGTFLANVGGSTYTYTAASSYCIAIGNQCGAVSNSGSNNHVSLMWP